MTHGHLSRHALPCHRPLDPEAARDCGKLLARSRTSDIADAAVAVLARADDLVLTGDASDIGHLLAACGTVARVGEV